jgi:hypothetical protein
MMKISSCHKRMLNTLKTMFFGVFLAIEGQRLEYRLQPAVLGLRAPPAKSGILNALSQRLRLN